MSTGGPDLFVICKNCQAEVSPYITECPYCGSRLRKRAPKLDREGRPTERKRRTPSPSLPRLRRGEIPGISPRRRRGSEGFGERRLRSVTRPSRSSFGARLRSRLPQYGHSVMYGLTSDWQFLQITNRSGPPVLIARFDCMTAARSGIATRPEADR